MKEGDEGDDFIVKVDSAKIPTPAAVTKAVPSDYGLQELSFQSVEGEATLKDGKPTFKAAGGSAVYRLEKGDAGEVKTHPLDALAEAVKDGPKKYALTGAVTEAKVDDQTVLKLGVTAAKPVEEKK